MSLTAPYKDSGFGWDSSGTVLPRSDSFCLRRSHESDSRFGRQTERLESVGHSESERTVAEQD